MQAKLTLDAWLEKISRIHPKTMDLGLERVLRVARTLQLMDWKARVIVVAGTNGKGSTVAALESVYLNAGFQVASYTSPHLYHFNERIKLQGQGVDEAIIIDAFHQIEAVRGDTTLTYFEFVTLSALLIFKSAPVQVAILEIGLGGRLDAVNIVRRDLSIITRIAKDHCEWLGESLNEIAREKAGIIHPNTPVVCGDPQAPTVIADIAAKNQAPYFQRGKDFDFIEDSEWTWHSTQKQYPHLPLGRLATENLATALMAIELLQQQLPVPPEAIARGLLTAFIPGRLQLITGQIPRLLDVSHNPDGAEHLARYLERHHADKRVIAVFSMLDDKDIKATVSILSDRITHWHTAPLSCERAAAIEKLAAALAGEPHSCYKNLSDAWAHAAHTAKPGDLLCVFGSFYTVFEVSRSEPCLDFS